MADDSGSTGGDLTRRGVLALAAISAMGAAGYASLSGSASPATSGWTQSRADPAGTGHNPNATGPTSKPEVSWSVEYPGTYPVPEPVVADETCFVATPKGLLAVDVADGSIRRVLTDQQTELTPAIGGSGPYRTPTIVGNTGRYVGFDSSGGGSRFGVDEPATRWRLSPATLGESPPVVRGDRWFGIYDGRIHAVDVHDGSHHWRAGSNAYWHRRPSVSAERVVYVEGDDGVVALDVDTGDRDWVATDVGANAGEDPHNPPILVDGRVVLRYEDAVVVLDGETGQEIARGSVEDADKYHYFHTTVADGIAYVPEGGSDVESESALRAIDIETGATVFRVETGPGRVPERVAVAAETVYCGVNDGVLALDRTSGDKRWQLETGGGNTTVVPVGDRLLVGTTWKLLSLEVPR